jgi:lipid II:glycine glycyltransferase (peptidoglycan interpeptide bridge formation enzyme)
MLITDRKILTFHIKEVHFSDYPHDIEGCDFLNFHSCKNKVNPNGFNCQKELTSVIDLTQDLDKIWQDMDKKSARYRINRAQREGIKIRINKDYDQFYQIYRSFIQKSGIKSLFDVFGVGSTSLETMKKYGTLFVAEYDGEILVGTIYLIDNSNMKAWIGASKRLEVDRAKASIISNADRLIDWEAIKYAKEKGIKEFDLGGLWSKEEVEKDESKKGINSYKLSYGGKIVTCYSYQKIYSKVYALAYNLFNLKKLAGKKTNGRF